MRFIILTLCLFLALFIKAGGQSTEFRFTAENNGNHVQLDSVRFINLTQLCDTVIYYPDTVLSLMYDAVNEHQSINDAFRLYPCYPNPVKGSTHIKLFVPEKDQVTVMLTDAFGRSIMNIQQELERGYHHFLYVPANAGFQVFTASWRGKYESIRLMSTVAMAGGNARLEYQGNEYAAFELKNSSLTAPFVYYVDDKVLLVAYSGLIESGLIDKPRQGRDYRFQFAANIPCPDMPVVDYDGRQYNTIQIFNQCWLKENLNVGYMRESYYPQVDNDTIEKYCYQNEPENCTKYGGLYSWDEMMNYSHSESAQGICPAGWHIPSDDEFKLLEGAVDSLYGIGDTLWDVSWIHRGYDAAYRLKSTHGWWQNGNGNDFFGFSAVPGGLRWHNMNFNDLEVDAYFWTSTEHTYSTSWYRLVYYHDPRVYRNGDFRKVTGLSVRCVRDLK